jgi:Zn finger protein HypA/HybF involved in hydrogenase expression
MHSVSHNHDELARDIAEMKLDGNAIGGLLREIFTMEVTNAETTCASCGAVNEVGRVEVYNKAPGTVVRCPACHAVLMRIVRGRGRYWLDMTGTRSLELAGT